MFVPLKRQIFRTVLILLTPLVLALCFTPRSQAAEDETQPKTKDATTQQAPASQEKGQPEQKAKGTKTKLEPRDLLPSLLTPKPGTGSTAAEQSLVTRDQAQLRRLQSGNARVNQRMRQLNYSIQRMRSNINRTLGVRRLRY